MVLARNGCVEQSAILNERRARSIRTPALILKRRNYGEADRLLTLLTPENGKLTALARGARKPSSRKGGHVELLMHSDLLLRRGRGFLNVDQAEGLDAFPRLRADLERGAYGIYLAELLDHFFVGEEDGPLPEFFAETLAALHALCEEEDAPLVLRHFELRLLTVAGFQPELRCCTVTGQPLQPRDQYFSHQGGGVISPEGRAAAGGHDLQPIALATLKLLRYLQNEPHSRVKSLRVSAKLHEAAEALLQGYIASILERRLASVRFLQRVRRDRPTKMTP